MSLKFIGPNGVPSWCVDDDEIQAVFSREGNWYGDDGNATPREDIVASLTFYLCASVVFTLLDVALLPATWSAASVGTPTEPRGRDTALRTIIWMKITVMNLLLGTVMASGVFFIYEGRRTNYGCGEKQGRDGAVDRFEQSPWYRMFCVVMCTYAFEFLLWPCILLNQLIRKSITVVKNSTAFRNAEMRLTTTAALLGDCFKCLRCLSCNQAGGGKIRAQAHLKDAAVTFLDYFNSNTHFDLVLSDLYIAFKMLNRISRERKYKKGEQARMDKERNKEEQMVLQRGFGLANHRTINAAAPENSDKNHLNFFAAEDKLDVQNEVELGTGTMTKTLLRQTEASEIYPCLVRYSKYALFVYDHLPNALLAAGKLVGGRSGVYQPLLANSNGDVSLYLCHLLNDLGFSATTVIYATFENDVLATPFAVLVDEEDKSVVVSIQGTATLEDVVTDLQFGSSKLDRVGEVCGFCGKDMYAHRGMLAKSKWVFNQLVRLKILTRLFHAESSKNTNDFKLIVTGHSLGAGIAAILSCMLRPTYSDLMCYAFCPPGCTVSRNLACQNEDYVISVVVGNDVIPRVRSSNFEMLRYELLETLARIKVSKIRAWRDIRKPCKNKDLVRRNEAILFPRNKIPKSEYFRDLESFGQNRMELLNQNNPVESRLNIPGKIIHLVHKMDRHGKYRNKYVPYWESRLALREVELSMEVVKEHSIENLVKILTTVATDHENTLKGIAEEEDAGSVGSNHSVYEEELNDFSDDHWFILCSRPQGNVSLIPTLLSIAGFLCSTVGNNVCSLFSRETVGGRLYLSTQGVFEEVSLGLYTYGVRYYHGGVDDYVLTCSLNMYAEITNDVYVSVARGFSVLAIITGLPTMCFLCLSNCMILRQKSFHRITVSLFFVSCTEALVFLFLLSKRCHEDFFPEFPGEELGPCHLNHGSKLAISGSVMWLLAAVFTGYIERARKRDERRVAVAIQESLSNCPPGGGATF